MYEVIMSSSNSQYRYVPQLTITSSADPDEMLHHAAFSLGLPACKGLIRKITLMYDVIMSLSTSIQICSSASHIHIQSHQNF